MSRTLEALRQIEARSLQAAIAERPSPADAADLSTDAADLSADAAEHLRLAESAVSSALSGAAEGSQPSDRQRPPGFREVLKQLSVTLVPQTHEEPDAQREEPDAQREGPESPREQLQPEPVADPRYVPLAETILQEFRPGQSAVLLFVSVDDADGTTETVASLAPALAERVTGEVLAVDCHFDRPQLADRLGAAEETGMAADWGLADVLHGDARWQEVVHPAKVKRLAVLPGVPLPAAPARSWESARPAALWKELKENYQFVLLDAPTAVDPRVAALVQDSDGAYLVIRLGQTPRRAARKAARTLRQSGARLLGCVVL